MAPVFGVYNDEEEEDGPVEHAKLSCPIMSLPSKCLKFMTFREGCFVIRN